MTPESAVKKACVALLKQWGAYYFFPAANGYGRAGIPDIVGCLKGRFFSIECKAGKNVATALQLRELEKIRDAGGVALIVYEDTLWQLQQHILKENI